MADDAGALLVRSGLVSASALEDARSRVGTDGGTLGEQLVAAGALADDVLTDFYKTRLLVPQVNPNTLARLPAKVVAVIPSNMAIELRAIPVSLDAENTLTVAMSDPSDRHAVDEIAYFTSAYVVRAVATQMQIAWCLAHYYGHVTYLGQRLLQPNAPAPSRALQAAIKPRTRGVTDKVNAARHKALVPGVAVDADAARPTSEVLDEPTAPTVAPPEADESPEPAEHNEPTKPVASAEPAEHNDAVPVRRASSVSGEIRVPPRRAPSIRPQTPDFEHESGPVVSIEPDEPGESEPPPPEIELHVEPADPPTELRPPAPRRKRPAEPDPPELAARAGEVDMKTGPIRDREIDEGPRVVIDEELERAAAPPQELEQTPTAPLAASIEVSGELRVPRRLDRPVTPPQITVELGTQLDDDVGTSVVIHEHMSTPSEPVLLERLRASGPKARPDAVPDEADDDVVVLEAKKVPKPRKERDTKVGIGAITATTRERTGSVDIFDLDAQTTAHTRNIDNDDNDPTRLDTVAAPSGDFSSSDEILAAPPSPVHDDDTSPIALPPSSRMTTPVPPPSGKVRLDNVRPRRPGSEDDGDEDTVRARPTEVMSTVELRALMAERSESVDDGWGPPGTALPPTLLGEIPGSAQRRSGVIPVPNVDSRPLMVAAPVAPEVSRPDLSPQALGRALEEATARVLDLIRALDVAIDRDSVITTMVAHLAQTHRRAGFFAVRAGELSLFALAPPPKSMPEQALRLDRPSTLQDIVDTRLPYRGPMHDDTSRAFLTAVLGSSPPEILLVPVSVRERVVGVLFGEQRMRHTFDDQLALAGRAAGAALERILKARR